MPRDLLVHCIAIVLLAVMHAGAGAQPSTFRLTQVLSNLDGSVHFIELTESAGMSVQHRLAGLTLTSGRNGIVKQFSIPHECGRPLRYWH
jgi:hypothetical protein